MPSEHVQNAKQGKDGLSEGKSGEQSCEISARPSPKRLRLPISLRRLKRSAQVPFRSEHLTLPNYHDRRNLENANAELCASLHEDLKLSRAGLNHGPPLVREQKERLNEWIENTRKIEERYLTDATLTQRTWCSNGRISHPILPELRFSTMNEIAELCQKRAFFAPIRRTGACSVSDTICFDLELIQRQLNLVRALPFDLGLELTSFFPFIHRNWYTTDGPSKNDILDQTILRRPGPRGFDLRAVESTSETLLDDLKPFSDSSQFQSDADKCSKLVLKEMRNAQSPAPEAEAEVVSHLAITGLEHNEVSLDCIEQPILQASMGLKHAGILLESIPMNPTKLSKLSSVQSLTEYCNAFSSRIWYKRPKAMMDRQKGKLVKFFSTVKHDNFSEHLKVRQLELEEDTLEIVGKFRQVPRIGEILHEAELHLSLDHDEDGEFDSRFLDDYFCLLPTTSYPLESMTVRLTRDKEELEQSTDNYGGSATQSTSVRSNLTRKTSFHPNEIQPIDPSGGANFLSFGALGEIDNYLPSGNQEQSDSTECSTLPK